ncbi:MAG: hypothetical protein OEY77_02290 [Nitrospira sp.]|nr:hypothetical protein [Nitrospira sp.]
MPDQTQMNGSVDPPKRERSVRPPLFFIVALLLLIVPLGLCWTLYEHHTSERRAYLMERNFRYLAHRGDHLRNTIRQYEKLFQSIDGAAKALGDQGGAAIKETDSSVCEEHSSVGGKDGLAPSPKWLVKQLCGLPSMKRVVINRPKAEEARTPAPFGIRARLSADALVLDYRHAGSGKEVGHFLWNVTTYLDLDSILRALPVEELFGYLLLADSAGTVFHQSSSALRPSEFRFSNIPTLGSTSQPKEKIEGTSANTPPLFGRFQMGDVDHVLFGQGGRWPHGQGNANGSSSNVHYDFLVVGIVPAHDFTVEATSIPTSYLFATIGLILMATLSLPYIRLRHMRSFDALSRRDVLILLYCAALWVGAATFVVVILNTLRYTKAVSESTLETAAKAITTNFTEEFERARDQLSALDALCRQECVTDGKLKGDGTLWSQGLRIVSDQSTGDKKSDLLQIRGLKVAHGMPLTFDELSKVLWVDAKGWKRVDWAWKPSTRRVRLGEREYVTAIQSGKPFWVQSIRSWTTGDNFAIISTQSTVSAEAEGSFVVALEGKLPSVMDRAVPPGMGFAMINEQGEVQFHSDSHRNTRENFLVETDRNETLQASMWTRTPMHFSGQYWGKDRRFFIEPVSWKSTNRLNASENEFSPNWFLVVYLDQDLIDTPLLEAGFFAVSIFVLYAALILGLGLFWLLINRFLQPENEGLLWPNQRYARAYVVVCMLNIALLTLYGALRFSLFPPAITSTGGFTLGSLFMVIVLPVVLVVVVRFLLLRPSPISILSWFPEQFLPNYRIGYLSMFVSTLLLFAMVPAFNLFQMAYSEEMRLYARFAQYDSHKDQLEAQSKWKKYYHDQLVSADESLNRSFISKRHEELKQPCGGPQQERRHSCSAIAPFVFASGQEPALSESLPVYSAFRGLLNSQFGTETARFLNTGKADNKQSDATPLPLEVLPYSYWAMIVITALIAFALPTFLPRPGKDGTSGISSPCPSSWIIGLFVLSLTLCTLLVRPSTGIEVVGLLAFGCIAYGIPHLVTKQVFFLWEAPEGNASQQEIEQQWSVCTPREKLILAHLAQNHFLTTVNKETFDLVQKGLVHMAPRPRLTNDGPEVRKFILEKSQEEKVFEKACEGGSDVWEQGIWTIKLGLIGFGGMVLFTQEEFRPVILAALAPALPVLLKLPVGLDPTKLLTELVSKGRS